MWDYQYKYTILLFNNTAFSKEQDGKHNDAKTASEQQVMNNSNDNYFDDNLVPNQQKLKK